MAAVYDDWGMADGYYGIDGTLALYSDRHPRCPCEPRWASRCDPGDVVRCGGQTHALARSLPTAAGGRHRLIGDARRTIARPADRLPPTSPARRRARHHIDRRARRCREAPLRVGRRRPDLLAVATRRLGHRRPPPTSVARPGDRDRGGTALLLSPLHAPTPTAPHDDSPYYPSSRRWLNPLLIPIDEPRPIANVPAALIDRNRVVAGHAPRTVERFRRVAPTRPSGGVGRAQGPTCGQFCTWTPLAERLGPRWRSGRSSFATPTSHQPLPAQDARPIVRRSVRLPRLAAVAHRAHLARDRGSAGSPLIGDLAVGCSPDGADCGSPRSDGARRMRFGAPPDPFNASRAGLGPATVHPGPTAGWHYRPFIGMRARRLRDMAGLRIDHVMGLFRQFWIPPAASPPMARTCSCRQRTARASSAWRPPAREPSWSAKTSAPSSRRFTITARERHPGHQGVVVRRQSAHAGRPTPWRWSPLTTCRPSPACGSTPMARPRWRRECARQRRAQR